MDRIDDLENIIKNELSGDISPLCLENFNLILKQLNEARKRSTALQRTFLTLLGEPNILIGKTYIFTLTDECKSLRVLSSQNYRYMINRAREFIPENRYCLRAKVQLLDAEISKKRMPIEKDTYKVYKKYEIAYSLFLKTSDNSGKYECLMNMAILKKSKTLAKNALIVFEEAETLSEFKDVSLMYYLAEEKNYAFLENIKCKSIADIRDKYHQLSLMAEYFGDSDKKEKYSKILLDL